MDGTLTQTNQLIYDSFNYIAQKYRGRTYSIPEITAMFGPPEEDALLAIVGPQEIPAVMKEYLEFYQKNHSRLARLYPGIKETLQYIRERHRSLAIFTGKGVRTTTITLREFGLDAYFDAVVTGNDVVNHKPSSEGILKILERFSLRPEEALMVGDAVSDVKAAHEAGVPMAAVLWDSYGKERVMHMGADYLFHDVEEFHRWIKAELD